MTHLVSLVDGWTLWRWACLRATGFPARLVESLADPELAAAADELLAVEQHSLALRDITIAECRDASVRVAPEDRGPLQKALQRLYKHRVPDPLADPRAEAARTSLASSVATEAARTSSFGDRYKAAALDTSHAIRAAASNDRFRQALLWQNRSAVSTGVDGLLRHPVGATDSKTRGNERLIASYLQRYCVKNDTIGFFGPFGWARLSDATAPITETPSPQLIAHSTVYFEYWAVAALAARLSADPELKPYLSPRLLPQFRIAGTTLFIPIGRSAELPPEVAAVAMRCDGQRSAISIARDLVGSEELPDLASVFEVFEVIEELVGERILTWELEVPTAGHRPELALAHRLETIEAEEPRRRALAVLSELDRLRAVVAASHDSATLDPALRAFAAAFTLATETSSERAHGQTYAARTPLYEDCRRGLALELGRTVLDRMAAPLALVLKSARWFTYEIAVRYREAFSNIHARLRTEAQPVVEFDRFWHEIIGLFPGKAEPSSIVGMVRDELRKRWSDILAIDRTSRIAQRSAAALTALVDTAFRAPCPGWPAARHQSPDILIAARGPDAITRGDFVVVLGELHSGFNTVTLPLFVKEHPNPEELVAARDADLGRAGVVPVWSKAITRGDSFSVSPGDFDLEVGDTVSPRARAQVLVQSELVVVDVDGSLEVQTRDQRQRFDIIAFLEQHLIAESFAEFAPIAHVGHTPRIVIDQVVLSRETWQIVPGELAWPALEHPHERYLGARRWAQQLGLPRWVFAKTPEEVKPVFVDFASTVYVEMLAKQLRGASAASFSEMLPTIDESWVRDAADERYTAELRIAALDPEAWRPQVR
jgi:hypothetical protein